MEIYAVFLLQIPDGSSRSHKHDRPNAIWSERKDKEQLHKAKAKMICLLLAQYGQVVD